MTKLPDYILKSLRKGKTSLGEHPSFPPEEEEKFIVNLLSDTFDKLCEKVDIVGHNTLKNELSKVLSDCMKYERNNKQTLEQLCIKIITDMFDIPEDTVKITSTLVDTVDTSSQRLIPEKTVDFSFDDIDDMNKLTDEIYKRRMIDVLIAGASMYYMNFIANYLKEIFEINPDLPSLYKKLIDYNNILLYIEKDTIDNKKAVDGGKVDVVIGSSDTIVTIDAQALVFPVLVEETIKGVLELAVAKGLPKDVKKAKYIMSKADFKLAELWDMRLGYALWSLIEKRVKDCEYDMEEIGINFLLMEFSKMECDEFNKTLQEIFGRTKKGERLLSEIIENILYNKEKDEFDDFIKTSNDSQIVLTDNDDDEYFTPENILITDDYEY